jgi:hypothetical protein
VTCPWHVTYEQFYALPPSSDRRIKNQRPAAMNSTWPQCRSQCTSIVHRLESVDCAYATELSTVHCYSILILAVHFRPNGPDRKAPVTCPWHVTGSQSNVGCIVTSIKLPRCQLWHGLRSRSYVEFTTSVRNARCYLFTRK